MPADPEESGEPRGHWDDERDAGLSWDLAPSTISGGATLDLPAEVFSWGDASPPHPRYRRALTIAWTLKASAIVILSLGTLGIGARVAEMVRDSADGAPYSAGDYWEVLLGLGLPLLLLTGFFIGFGYIIDVLVGIYDNTSRPDLGSPSDGGSAEAGE